MIEIFNLKWISAKVYQIIAVSADAIQMMTSQIPAVQPLDTPVPTLLEHEGLLWVYGLVLIIAAGFALKYWFNNFGVKFKGSKTAKLKILEVRAVGAKQSLMVAQYEGQKMLLGVSPGIIQLITRLDSQETADTQDTITNHLVTDLITNTQKEKDFKK